MNILTDNVGVVMCGDRSSPSNDCYIVVQIRSSAPLYSREIMETKFMINKFFKIGSRR